MFGLFLERQILADKKEPIIRTLFLVLMIFSHFCLLADTFVPEKISKHWLLVFHFKQFLHLFFTLVCNPTPGKLFLHSLQKRIS